MVRNFVCTRILMKKFWFSFLDRWWSHTKQWHLKTPIFLCLLYKTSFSVSTFLLLWSGCYDTITCFYIAQSDTRVCPPFFRCLEKVLYIKILLSGATALNNRKDTW